jgi:hypothetical protein
MIADPSSLIRKFLFAAVEALRLVGCRRPADADESQDDQNARA